MSSTRKGETKTYPFRTERIFSVGNEWYFTTREGKDIGPFTSKADTEGELTAYLRTMAMSNESIDSGDNVDNEPSKE